MIAIYRKRDTLFDKGETEWRVEDDALVRKTPDGTETRYPWAEVVAVRVRANPTMAKSWLHQTTIATTHTRFAIDNSHFVGLSEFEDRSADYSPFVRAALDRIAENAPAARVEIGAAQVSFWLQVLFMSASFVMLALVFFYIPLPAPLPLAVIVKLGVIVYLMTLLPRWLRGSRPRHGDFKCAAEDLP
jgi:hypothetical protein